MTETAVKSHADIVRILEIYKEVEEHFAKLYRHFADKFQNNSELSELWLKTAKDEDNHANQFALAIKLHGKGVVEDVSIDILKAESVLNLVKSVCAGVSKTELSAIDALRTAIKIEIQLADFHMDSIALFVEESYKKLFRAMMEADQGHVERLRDAYQDLLK